MDKVEALSLAVAAVGMVRNPDSVADEDRAELLAKADEIEAWLSDLIEQYDTD